MSQLSPILRDSTGNGLSFWCPGCNSPHRIQHGEGDGPRWGWNGDVLKPTFTPSVLVWWDEPANWNDEAALNRDIEEARRTGGKIPQVAKRCHSFVTDGRIQFLGDCTHSLANQTVDLPTWPERFLK